MGREVGPKPGDQGGRSCLAQSQDGEGSGSNRLVREETESAMTHHVGGQGRCMGQSLDMEVT